MNQLFRFTVKSKNLFILLFPLFYFFVGVYFRLILEDPSLRSVDPDYVYFMSGLNISEGIFKVIHIDHPGTPLQYLAAIVFKITWLFRENPSGYVADVLGNPNLYLSMVNLSITAILFVSLYFAGKYILNKTGSLLYAMLVQTIPLISVILYEMIGRIMPELLLPLPILALTTFLIVWVNGNKEQFSKTDLIFLSFILAFGLSIKLTLIPLWIIPLIIVRGWKHKLMVMLMSVVFFLIIAVPVTLQFERFWNWGKALFLYSGQYGNGEKNIINIPEFITNLGEMVRIQKHFSFLVALMVLTVIFSFFRFRKKQNARVQKMIIITVAILLAIFFQILMAGKQYAPRYFMPALMFGPLLIFLFIEIIKEIYPNKYLRTGFSIVLILFMGWILRQQLGVIGYTSEAFETQIVARKETRNLAETFEKGCIKIIVSQDYGCPFIEYALQFSLVWSAPSLSPKYIEYLSKIYPNTYQYTTWDGQFRYWGEPFNAEKIIERKIPVYLYLEKNTEELYNLTIKKLSENDKGFKVDKKLLFENPVNGESLIQLFFSNLTATATDSVNISSGK